MKFGKSFILCAALVFSLFQLGCQPADSGEPVSGEANDRYSIVCTVGMISDVVRNVVGDFAEVEGIIGEGVDPHLYQPTRGDVVKLRDADVVFYNGLLLEGKMTGVLERAASSGKAVKAVTEAILMRPDYLLEKEDGSAHTDPHVWMDVQGWKQSVPVITETLVGYDPERAAAYLAKGASI